LGLRWTGSEQSVTSRRRSPHLPACKAAWSEWADFVADLPAEQRLQRIMRLTPGQFESLGNAITASDVTYDLRLKVVIEACCKSALGETGVVSFKAGSSSTKTAICLGSDLDVNVNTTSSVTRSQRESIASCLEQTGLDGVRISKKCIKLEWTSRSTVFDVDVAFTDTQFETGVIDRGSHLRFFEDCPTAQNVVKMLKFAFHDVRSLSGFMYERLLMRWSSPSDMARLSSMDIFDIMLEVIYTNAPVLRETLRIAIQEHESDQAYADEQWARVERMQNVIASSFRRRQ